ncbi:MAG: ABC transporter permease [Lachnospiraceae bacterium]|nr:ABC transporter permease [Lachnospiraceae bacterium]
MDPNKKSLLKNDGFQSFLSSIVCILLGLLIGYIVLLFINPAGATKAILVIIKNFLKYPSYQAAMKYLGSTLVKAAPLLLCSLSVLFSYKTGLFNIGAAGQYAIGAGLCLYCALALRLPWFVCIVAAMLGGALLGVISGILKAFCNVNEVISGIMLNWISLYVVNMMLTPVKEESSHYTMNIANVNKDALLPSLGLNALFANNQYVTLALPLSVICAIVIFIILEKTKLGFELRATGLNKDAAKYSGMAEKSNTVLTLAIGGALAALGASLFYLSGYEQWSVTSSSVPAMGFNGIAAAFLGGLSPVGAIFSSFFIQHITEGGAYVDKTMYCSQISDLISSIIIYLCGFVLFMKHFMNNMLQKSENKKALKAASENKEGGEE